MPLRLPLPIRPTILPRLLRAYTTHTPALPRIAQPSLWSSLVPRFLRRDAAAPQRVKVPFFRNPATAVIVLGILCGSQAIQVMTLKRQTVAISRDAEAKLELLREVIRRVQNGENVDIKGMLGTGDPVKEKEWQDVLQEIESDAELVQRAEQGMSNRGPTWRLKEHLKPASRSESKGEQVVETEVQESGGTVETRRKPAFY